MKLWNASHWIILLSMSLIVACAKDEGPVYIPAPPLPPGVAMDTVYFNSEVLPIFVQHCWTCHPTMGGLDLGATEAYNNLVNVTTTGYAPQMRIVPGDPGASVLWHKVSGSPSYGLTMPPNGTTLSATDLQLIHDWIEQGSLDN